MSWLAEPNPHSTKLRRDHSPKRYTQPSTRWRGRPLSRLFSWCLCVVVVLVIVFWPKKHTNSILKARRKPSNSPSLPTAHRGLDVDSHKGIKKPKRQRPGSPLDAPESTEHIYRPDGLLNINPRGKHPIFELIERSETQWKRKVERQSKTLKQAIEEYKRRYKRPPPKGFEIWWDYADFHDVKLIDEYDSIHARLQPFWAVPPATLIATQTAWESHSDTFTIGKIPGSSQIELLSDMMRNSSTGYQRAQEQLELLEDVEEWLPEFRATFTMHDGPMQYVSWELKKRAEEAAEKGEFIDVEQIAASVTAKGWTAACPPTSPIQSYTPPPLSFLPSSPPTRPAPPGRSSSHPRTLIYNHPLSMSPCLHPTHLVNIGYLSQYRYPHQYGPSPANYLAPTFSICVSPLHSDILTAAPEQFVDDVGGDPDWADKVDERLLWRGRNTGVLYTETNMWNASQRIRLVEMGTRRGGETTVLMPRSADGDGVVGHGESVRTSALNAAFMDVAFVDKPIHCRGSVCNTLERMFEWRRFQSGQDAWTYKYIMDIDGNGWSARFKRLMTSKSLIFKSTIFPEWYTERIMPWVHYIPVQVDLSDIYDILAFFRGDLSGVGEHDQIAEKIATAGREWSKTFYRREDMTAYHFRMFLEYARVMSLDRDAMNYEDEDESYDKQLNMLGW